MARLEIPVSGWTCLRTATRQKRGLHPKQKAQTRGATAQDAGRVHWTRRGKLTLVDVGRVRLLPGLGALLLVARGSGCLLAGLLLLSGRLAGRGLAAGGGSLLGLGGILVSVGVWEMEKSGEGVVELGAMDTVSAVGERRDGGRKVAVGAGTRYLWRARSVL